MLVPVLHAVCARIGLAGCDCTTLHPLTFRRPHGVGTVLAAVFPGLTQRKDRICSILAAQGLKCSCIDESLT
jgi:hypothetical protein